MAVRPPPALSFSLSRKALNQAFLRPKTKTLLRRWRFWGEVRRISGYERGCMRRYEGMTRAFYMEKWGAHIYLRQPERHNFGQN